jgi:acetyl-CoA carboxylase carboxyl transferase subunit alpha
VGAGLVGAAIQRHLADLKAMPVNALIAARQLKFRNIAQCYT